ncbi:MAG: hypothetical protein MHPSP_002300, partial [Paramarteilia canceri]
MRLIVLKSLDQFNNSWSRQCNDGIYVDTRIEVYSCKLNSNEKNMYKSMHDSLGTILSPNKNFDYDCHSGSPIGVSQPKSANSDDYSAKEL